MDADDLYKIQDPNSVFLSTPFLQIFVFIGILILYFLLFCAGKYWGGPNGNFLQRFVWMIYDHSLHFGNSIIQWAPEGLLTFLSRFFRNPQEGEATRQYSMTAKEIKRKWAARMRKHQKDPRKMAHK
jgi:hypothetical protein